jgi:hypothetical protein
MPLVSPRCLYVTVPQVSLFAAADFFAGPSAQLVFLFFWEAKSWTSKRKEVVENGAPLPSR